ncbi:hypothetical protein Tco_0189417 [Tanacetum coccineum]
MESLFQGSPCEMLPVGKAGSDGSVSSNRTTLQPEPKPATLHTKVFTSKLWREALYLESLDLVNHHTMVVDLRDGSSDQEYLLEVVDNGFGFLALWACVNLRSRRVFNPKGLINKDKVFGWLGLCTQPTPREVDSGVEKVKALGDNGVMSGSRVRIVWMEVGGGVVRARVVSRVVVKVMLIGFWVEELALDAMMIKE